MPPTGKIPGHACVYIQDICTRIPTTADVSEPGTSARKISGMLRLWVGQTGEGLPWSRCWNELYVFSGVVPPRYLGFPHPSHHEWHADTGHDGAQSSCHRVSPVGIYVIIAALSHGNLCLRWSSRRPSGRRQQVEPFAVTSVLGVPGGVTQAVLPRAVSTVSVSLIFNWFGACVGGLTWRCQDRSPQAQLQC